jgi:hypothetical protein
LKLGFELMSAEIAKIRKEMDLRLPPLKLDRHPILRHVT